MTALTVPFRSMRTSATRDGACVRHAQMLGMMSGDGREGRQEDSNFEDKIEDKCFVMCLKAIFCADLLSSWCFLFHLLSHGRREEGSIHYPQAGTLVWVFTPSWSLLSFGFMFPPLKLGIPLHSLLLYSPWVGAGVHPLQLDKIFQYLNEKYLEHGDTSTDRMYSKDSSEGSKAGSSEEGRRAISRHIPGIIYRSEKSSGCQHARGVCVCVCWLSEPVKTALQQQQRTDFPVCQALDKQPRTQLMLSHYMGTFSPLEMSQPVFCQRTDGHAQSSEQLSSHSKWKMHM